MNKIFQFTQISRIYQQIGQNVFHFDKLNFEPIGK